MADASAPVLANLHMEDHLCILISFSDKDTSSTQFNVDIVPLLIIFFTWLSILLEAGDDQLTVYNTATKADGSFDLFLINLIYIDSGIKKVP